jgi:hypothetical protein
MDSLVNLKYFISLLSLSTVSDCSDNETYCTRLSIIALGTMSIIVLLTML